MLKTGGYGLLRFVIPLFPDAAREIAPVAMILGVAGILYGAILAFAQTDLKRLVAYTSVSHLGFVLLGAFAMNELALQGAVVTMIAHGLSTGALFFIAGALQHRLHTREMASMGGVWSIAPTLSGAALAFTMASAGLPGLADFVGEFLTLLGTWQASPPLAVAAALGILGATIYGLKLLHQTFFGPNRHGLSFPDLSWREVVIVGSLLASLVCLGLYPRPLIETATPSLRLIQQTTVAASIEQEVQP
jgi:NADH-quinone oxidoreductase subunit M